MIINRTYGWEAACIFVILCFCVTSAVTALGKENVVVSVDAYAREIIIGEPIIIDVRVVNTGKENLPLFNLNGPGIDAPSHAKVHISRDGQPMTAWGHELSNVVERRGPSMLAGGDTLHERLVVAYSRRTGLVTLDVERIHIEVKFISSTELRFVEEVGEVAVRDIDRPEDAASWETLEPMADIYGLLIQVPNQVTGHSLSDSDREFFEKFVNDHAESRHAEYIALFLGKHYLAIARKPETVSTIDHVEAINNAREWFSWVINNSKQDRIRHLAEERVGGLKRSR